MFVCGGVNVCAWYVFVSSLMPVYALCSMIRVPVYALCSMIRVLAENWVGLSFLWSVFLYETNPNPRKKLCCGKKWPKWQSKPRNFSRVGSALGWGARRFHDN